MKVYLIYFRSVFFFSFENGAGEGAIEAQKD